MFLALTRRTRLACAKLLHPPNVRCIHCGYEPEAHRRRRHGELFAESSR